MTNATTHAAKPRPAPHGGVWRRVVARCGSACRALENPVLGRELRARMRGARSHLIVGAYAAVLAVVVLIVYGNPGGAVHQGPSQFAAEVGRAIWNWGCLAQALLLPLIVPALTCGAITQERERDMLDLLLLTRQSALQICLGKLA